MEGETWAIVELMGHLKMAGKLSEEERFGSKVGRLDIPSTETCICPNGERVSVEQPTVECCRCSGTGRVQKWITQWFGGASVYRITVVTEDVARHVSRQTAHAPVAAWDFPRQLSPPKEPVPNKEVAPAQPPYAYEGNDDEDDGCYDDDDNG